MPIITDPDEIRVTIEGLEGKTAKAAMLETSGISYHEKCRRCDGQGRVGSITCDDCKGWGKACAKCGVLDNDGQCACGTAKEAAGQKKILFLDFDGVLNSQQFFQSDRWDKRDDENFLSPEWWAVNIDPLAIELLNQIVRRTSCVVVASTTWRMSNTPEMLESILKSKGFIGRVVGKTPHRPSEPRRNEIIDVVRAIKPTAYAILDDDDDAMVGGHFVRVDEKTGLTPERVEAAVRILGGK